MTEQDYDLAYRHELAEARKLYLALMESDHEDAFDLGVALGKAIETEDDDLDALMYEARMVLGIYGFCQANAGPDWDGCGNTFRDGSGFCKHHQHLKETL